MLTTLHIHRTEAGPNEEVARKLIKLFLAAAILSPPGLGVLPVPVPLPIPIGLEAIKPPVITGPFPFHGGGLVGGYGGFGGGGWGGGGGGFAGGPFYGGRRRRR